MYSWFYILLLHVHIHQYYRIGNKREKTIKKGCVTALIEFEFQLQLSHKEEMYPEEEVE